MTASTSAFCLLANPTARSTALVANSVSLEVLESRVSIQSNNSSDFSADSDDLEFELDLDLDLDFVFEPELDFAFEVFDFLEVAFLVEDPEPFTFPFPTFPIVHVPAEYAVPFA